MLVSRFISVSDMAGNWPEGSGDIILPSLTPMADGGRQSTCLKVSMQGIRVAIPV